MERPDKFVMIVVEDDTGMKTQYSYNVDNAKDAFKNLVAVMGGGTARATLIECVFEDGVVTVTGETKELPFVNKGV